MTARSGGRLVLVATPIGNLGDLSPRAVDALGAAGVIACEDTRRTRALLAHAGVRTPRLLVVNDHSEAAQVREVIRLLDAGTNVAVVTDAGTPGVADPGARLVAAAAAAGHHVELVPGPSAAVAALVLSGLPAGRFCFEGFLPRKGTARRARLDAVRDEPRTTVIYEAPHRVRRTVEDLRAALGPLRRVSISRELTKLHEETWRGSLEAAVAHLGTEEPRGEYVIVVDGAPPLDPPADDDVASALRAELDAGADKKTAIAAVAGRFGLPKRHVYRIALGVR
jgi:16S rRNA (cytidine1402-2'-O)-methyltransferase